MDGPQPQQSLVDIHLSSDYISNLPADIKQRILVKLSLEEAARTSILSSRWKDLWITSDLVEIIKKLSPAGVSALFKFMKLSKGESSTKPQPVKVELPPMNLKLDGSATYLSWSRRVRGSLAGRNLEGYLTGEKEEPRQGAEGRDEWKSTNMLLYCWLLNSMVPSIAATVDGIEKVKDIWDKLRKTYAGIGNNFRVFQIIQEIDATVQGDRTVQEHAIEMERLWVDYDYFLPRESCKDPKCKRGEAFAQERTMKFLRGLAPVFEQMIGMLLAQTRLPPLEEVISAMIQQESRIKLQARAGRLSRVRSTLMVSNSGNTGTQGETRKCYNCGEIGHLRLVCPKPSKERYSGGRGHARGRGRGRGYGG